MIEYILAYTAAALLASYAAKKVADFMIIHFAGKQLCIFGDLATGKTTLHNFLSKTLLARLREEQRPEYDATTVEKVRASWFRVDGMTIAIKSTLDFGGDRAFRKEWRILYKESDVCLYLVDGKKLYNRDAGHRERVKEDLARISKWRKEHDEKQTKENNDKKKRKLHYIIVTFCDLVDELGEKSPRLTTDMDILRLIAPLNQQTVRNNMPVFLGSLKDDASSLKLVRALFKVLKNESR